VSHAVETAGQPGSPLVDFARRWIAPKRVAFVVLIVVTLFAAYSCQRSQVRISQSRAIAVARTKVDFQPQRTQIRLVRQGLNSHPYWAVSFSVGDPGGGYSKLTVVRVDANTGTVAAIDKQLPERNVP
jgi:hypothetical protein